jgi:hypothetical protein
MGNCVERKKEQQKEFEMKTIVKTQTIPITYYREYLTQDYINERDSCENICGTETLLIDSKTTVAEITDWLTKKGINMTPEQQDQLNSLLPKKCPYSTQFHLDITPTDSLIIRIYELSDLVDTTVCDKVLNKLTQEGW